MNDHEDRVRRRAYELWQQEGCPPGRERDHWERARELVAIEENQKYATIPVKKSYQNIGPTGEPVEPLIAAENAVGELPTLTDQGEEAAMPHPAAGTADADTAGNATTNNSAKTSRRAKSK